MRTQHAETGNRRPAYLNGGLCLDNSLSGRQLRKRRAAIGSRRNIPNYLDTLDGFRAYATVLVMLFHYWQQSWVGYNWRFQIGTYTMNINLEPWITTGAMGVEILFLLSGFCLFYPVAMNPDRPFNAREFAYKRFARIMPGYILCFLTGALLYMTCTPWAHLRSYQMSDAEWWYHFVGGLFFGQTATPRMFTNPFNGVLWSLPIEMQFYLIFPLVLRLFKKKPVLVTVCSLLLSESWRFWLRNIDTSNITFLMNQLPGMLDVFVFGMFAAYLTGKLKRMLNDDLKRQLAPVFTTIAVAMIVFFWLDQTLVYKARYEGGTQMSIAQMHMRKFDLASVGIAVMASAFSNGWLRRILGNPITRYLSTISYQLYMWHMLIGLKLKEWGIPPYTIPEGGSYPMHDEAWRMPYLMLGLGLSFVVATLITYLYEKPIGNALLRRKPAWTRGGSSISAELLVAAAGGMIYLLLQVVLASIL